MVLDPKNGHSDYGSFQTPEIQDSPAVAAESSQCQTSDEIVVLHNECESLRLAPDMTQSDLYQRQPLLPPSVKTDSWVGSGKSSVLHSPSSEYYDVEDKADGLTIHRNGGLGSSNGIVKIDIPAPLREEPRFPKEKWKTFIAFFILVVCSIITATALAVIHEKVPDREKVGPLPDVFLDNVKTADWALDVSEIIIMISFNTAFLVLIFHKHRYIVLRRIFMILAMLYLMRSVTMFVTVLPMASTTYYCSPKANTTSSLVMAKRVWKLISGFGLSINGKHTYCGDFIFSGHTVVLTMSYLIIAEYSPKRCFPFHWVSWLLSVVGVILVLVARGHYTVDVIIAYYATTTLFWMYHTMANNPNLKQNGPNNFLARLWWFPIFKYFEKNVGGPVPRQYEWPLPWPRWCHGKHPNRNS